MIDKKDLQITNCIEEIVGNAYKLGMPQVESEISDLAKFVQKDIFDKYENDPLYQYNILEIGTKYGGTFYIWNKLNSHGLNVSIDMHDGGIHGGVGDKIMNDRDLMFNKWFNNCHFIRGNSHDSTTMTKILQIFDKVTNKTTHQLFPDGLFDFIFIDGDHTFEGVKKDFYDYISFCKPKSFVCFHDIIISDHHHSRNVYVGEFWNEIKNNYKHWEIIGSDEQNWAGIGIIQLP